jgi:DNA polymerase V
MMKRQYGIKTGSRNYEIPTHDPRIIVVETRMATYLEFSMQVVHILKQFVPMECIHVYSVDECFITIDHSLFGTKWETVRAIQNKIRLEQGGLIVAAGMGNNYFQAKICLDVLAKNNAETGVSNEYS